VTPKEWRWVKAMLSFAAQQGYRAGYEAGKIGGVNQGDETPEAFVISKKSELVMKNSLDQFTSGKQRG